MEALENIQFGLLDYFFFVIVFILSMGIGLYFAIKSRKEDNSIEDYLLGGRKMGNIPVCCSIVATGVVVSFAIGYPAEVYAYGTYIWMLYFGQFVIAMSMHFIIFDVFHELKLTSTFKYFEMRFSRKVRLLASGIFLFCGFLLLLVTVYVPALSFQRVAGINIYVTVIVSSVLCASYTAIGGFKAVVWTDVIQLLLIFVSSIVVLIIGIQSVGGFGVVYDAANRGGRIVIANFDNFNSRSSWLPMLISYPLLEISVFGLNQTVMQRFLSLSSIRKMKLIVWLLMIPYAFLYMYVILVGITIYANYESCDPKTAGLIGKIDQILPHFIMEKATLFQGFSGIFIAGIFSACLSTTSSYLNAMSGILYEDFICLKYRNLSYKAANNIMKSMVFAFACLQILFVFFIEKMGMIMQIAMQCYALQGASTLTLFGLGILVPRANSKGAIAGALSSIVGLLVLVLGSLNNNQEPTLPFRIDGCNSGLNNTSSNFLEILKTEEEDDDTFWLFKLNFQYYGIIGTFLGISVGYLTSLATGGERVKNQKLLAVFLRAPEPQEEEEMQLRRLRR